MSCSSLLKSIFVFCIKFICFILVILYSLTFILYIPIFIYRFICAKLLIKLNKNLDKILTARSSLIASDEIYKNPKWVLVNQIILEGKIEPNSFINDFNERIVLQVDENKKLVRPELQQFVTSYLGYFFWAHDKSFNIFEHIQKFDTKKEVCNIDDLTELTKELVKKAFRPNKSPWEILVINNFKEKNDNKEYSVIVIRIHHCLADGFSILSILNDLSNPGTVYKSEFQPRTNPNKSFLLTTLTQLAILIKGPIDLVYDIRKYIDNISSWHPKKIQNEFNFGLSPKISIERIKKIKSFYEASFTGVILSSYTGALTKFMKEAGHKVPQKIHCQGPIPMPNHPPKKLRNHMSACPMMLPVGKLDPRYRLKLMDKELLYIKKSAGPYAFFYFWKIIGLLPKIFVKYYFKNNNAILMSNFPGPTKSWSYNEHKKSSSFFTGGTGNGNCGMSFTCLSYDGYVRFLVGIDESIVPVSKLPAQKIIDYFIEEIAALEMESIV